MGPSYRQKIVDPIELMHAVTEHRRCGRRIVLCHGCFDIVHPGHIRYLEFAKRHGDVLVVSLTGDAAIDKDSDRPYIPQELRAENLAALGCVDLVYIDVQHTAAAVLQAVRPEVYVKGEEYQRSRDPRFLQEQRIVEQHDGQLLFCSGDVVFSSSELIQRVGRETDMETRRLEYLCRRHGITAGLLEDVVERFSGCRVTVVGDLLLDRYVFCDAVDIARESPMMSLRQLHQRTYLGGAAIVARHLQELGAEVCLLASFGEDTPSRAAVAELQDGMEVASLLDRGPLVIKTRYLVEDRKLLKVECGEHRPLDTRAAQRARRVIQERSAGACAVVFCDFGYGVITEGLLADLLPGLRRAVPVIAADVSGTRGTLLNFKDLDLFCPTEREMRSTLNDFDQGLSAVAWKLMEDTRARHLIATLGRRGLVAFDRQTQDRARPEWNGRLRSEYIQALNSHAVDVLGCGDALLAGSTLALSVGATFVQAAYLGSAMAAIEAGHVGNIPVGAPGLRHWLAGRTEVLAVEREPVCGASPATAGSRSTA